MSLEGKKILIADDDPAFLRLISFSMARLGMLVTTAVDGREALDAFCSEGPDIVILDIMMPGMCGWEVCRSIRAVSVTPVLMISARREESDRARSLESGATAHLAKPLPIRQLVQQVRGLLAEVDPGL